VSPIGTTPEYAAVRHILESPRLVARSLPYVQPDGFDWPGLLTEAETMSGGEQVLVRVAHNLWTAKGAVRLHELPRRLDRPSFERVVRALVLCRSEWEGQLMVVDDAA
jgi:hypothetical protein